MARNSTANNPITGCAMVIFFIASGITAVFQWIKENPVLTILILLGFSILFFAIAYLLKESKNREQKEIYNHQTIMNSIHSNKTYTSNYKSESKVSNNTIKPEYQSTKEEQVDIEKIIVDITSCSKNEILTLDGFDNKKADKFIKERLSGKMWYDIESFVNSFELQPHEMILIQDRIKFPERPKNKYGRKIDI